MVAEYGLTPLMNSPTYLARYSWQLVSTSASRAICGPLFMTNTGTGHLTEYGYRWEIESGYKSIKRFMGATTSKHFGLRFFYFAFACLLYSIWRAVDLLVQVQLTGEYEHSPIVTADNTLTLLKKETGIG
ncbi:hypothetical protein SAMN05192561_10750 [Halopenitus malekzadehii]|uniref:Transposase DDE domain-containing protein n=1 Tax=Halopenitus malekzadehii TaxID=1267564 RepID=A0A1H6JBL3_9EURY|nr:hypothetical protein SAMN05192561_10750 [Halopenitus malekzadehii]